VPILPITRQQPPARITVYTRRGHDWTKRFKKVAADVFEIDAGAAIVDGEVVVPSAAGTTDFSVLQNELKGRSTKIVLVAFDLLYLNGYDLRAGARQSSCKGARLRRVSPSQSPEAEDHAPLPREIMEPLSFLRDRRRRGPTGLARSARRAAYQPSRKIGCATHGTADKALSLQ
jgi:ATP dependent DNA ligase domain